MKVVILAGGKGTRLMPYTTSFPKPLVPVGDKPILERIIRDLVRDGFTDIIVTVGHLAPLIQAYFGDGSKFGADIEYSLEEKPLGTIGPLNLIKEKLTEPFFLINGDILTDLNYKTMASAHGIYRKTNATIAVNKRSIKIDFGVADVGIDDNMLRYTEKPEIKYWVGMGVCIFSTEIFEFMPDGKMDLPDLLYKLMERGEWIQAYRHRGYWFDIGRPKDYEAACEFVENSLTKDGSETSLSQQIKKEG